MIQVGSVNDHQAETRNVLHVSRGRNLAYITFCRSSGMNLRSALNDVAETKWKETIDHLVRSHRHMIHTLLFKYMPAKVIQ